MNGFLKLMDREILNDVGKVSIESAKAHTQCEFEKYRIIQDHFYSNRNFYLTGIAGDYVWVNWRSLNYHRIRA